MMKPWKRLLAIGLLSLPALLPAQWALYHDSGKPHALIGTPDGGWVVASAGNISKLSEAGQVVWGQRFDSGPPFSYCRKAWLTPDGGVVAAVDENFGGTATLFKLSASGSVVWQKNYALDGARLSVFVPSHDGGTIMAGSLDSALLVCKCGPGGEIAWQRSYDTERIDEASAAAATPDGGLVVTASSRLPDNLDGSPGEADLWVLKLDPAGEVEWQKRIGGAADDAPKSVFPAAGGGYLITGWSASFAGTGQNWLLKLSSAGAVERQSTLSYANGSSGEIFGLVPVDDGTFLGAVIISRPAASVAIVVQIGQDGAVIREKAFELDCDSLYPAFAVPDEDGGILLSMTRGLDAGSFAYTDAHLMKLSPSWDIQWQKTYGSAHAPDEIQFLVPAGDGGYVLAGTTGSWGGLTDAQWLMRTHSDGSIGPNCPFVREADGKPVAVPSSVNEVAAAVTDTLAVPQGTELIVTASEIYFIPWGPVALPALGGPACTLKMRTSMSGGTTTPSWGDHVFATGTEVRLAAGGSQQYEFIGWHGNVNSSRSSLTVVMDGDKEVTADFHYHLIDDQTREKLGCFIATAAYGDPSHPDVEVLRRFRDRYLMKTRTGRAVVKLYYRYSPPLAEFVARRPALRAISRAALSPLVALSRLLLGTPSGLPGKSGTQY